VAAGAADRAMHDVPHDVIVVGAGPAGAVTAALLAERGRRVLLLERSKAPFEKICGEYLCPRAVENLERLGLTRAIERRRPRQVDGMLIVAPDGTEVEASFRGADGAPRRGWSLPRPELDGALQDEARARGATLLFDATVSDVTCETGADAGNGGARAPARVRVETRVGSETAPRSFTAAFVVGADGRFSCVARRLGLARPPRGRPRGVIHAWLRGTGCGQRGEMHFLGDDSYLGLDPLADGRLNVSLVCDAERVTTAARERSGEAQLRAALSRTEALARRCAAATIAGEVRYLTPVRNDVASVIAPRALLVGDAAGFLDPMTGEGIHFAIAEAELAAATLTQALERGRGDDPRALKPYARAFARLRRGKSLLHPLLQELLRHPRLGNAIGARLSAAPAAAERLLSVIGSLRGPAALAHPSFVGAMLRRKTSRKMSRAARVGAARVGAASVEAGASRMDADPS
jgi:flavin-dependent dehydrogenase